MRCARWAGLLHDVGHAPFSHTLEDACRFFCQADFEYDHEFYGAFLARRILEDLKNMDCEVVYIVLQVLNKGILLTDLRPLEILIRRIIDSPMDVDKGDYLLRDSYHCGVNYGAYDHDFLWNNVVITRGFQVGVLPKTALEAWSLTLARHKMFNYVYKHHVRNITDALLVEILQLAFTKITQARDSRDILPLRSHFDVSRDEYIHKFVYWTDNSLLKAVDALEDSEISSKIEAFSGRKLYKRSFMLNLSEYSNLPGNEPEIFKEIYELKKKMAEQGIMWNVMIMDEVPIPVFEGKVQRNILVQDDHGREVPLAEYLGFGIGEEFFQEKGDTCLHVFTHYLSASSKNNIRQKIVELLQKYKI